MIICYLIVIVSHNLPGISIDSKEATGIQVQC